MEGRKMIYKWGAKEVSEKKDGYLFALVDNEVHILIPEAKKESGELHWLILTDMKNYFFSLEEIIVDGRGAIYFSVFHEEYCEGLSRALVGKEIDMDIVVV